MRISIGFTQDEWDDLARAVTICEKLKPELGYGFEKVGSFDRNWWIRHAIQAVAKSVIRDGCENWVPLACDVRDETKEERAERLGEPGQEQLDLPNNIVPLFSTDAAGAVA